MTASGIVMTSAFVAVSSFVLLIFMLVTSRRGRLDSRMHRLAERTSRIRMPRRSLKSPGPPCRELVRRCCRTAKNAERVCRHGSFTRGYYGSQAIFYYLGVKMVLMVSPACLGLAIGLLVPRVSVTNGTLYGAVCGVIGLIGPPFWLRHRRISRQTSFRRALPDALDVLVVCLEGGLSLPAAFRRVAGELRTAHPLLAKELNIVQREIQMGRSTGEALRQFADRVDLEELRSLASVIIQAERFGASLVKALRVHADTLRVRRMQLAEEMGQKAAIKVLFPTLLCIFPGIFIVILGPALIRLATEMVGRFYRPLIRAVEGSNLSANHVE